VLLAIVGGTSLIVLSANHAGAREIISAAVFTATRVVMYVPSTLYHAISQPPPSSVSRCSTTARSSC